MFFLLVLLSFCSSALCLFALVSGVLREDMGRPVRFSSSTTAGSSWPWSRWRRTMTWKRTWYHYSDFISPVDTLLLFHVLLCVCSSGRSWSTSLSRVMVTTTGSWPVWLKWLPPMATSFSGNVQHIWVLLLFFHQYVGSLFHKTHFVLAP